jgi:hypothetical protein
VLGPFTFVTTLSVQTHAEVVRLYKKLLRKFYILPQKKIMHWCIVITKATILTCVHCECAHIYGSHFQLHLQWVSMSSIFYDFMTYLLSKTFALALSLYHTLNYCVIWITWNLTLVDPDWPQATSTAPGWLHLTLADPHWPWVTWLAPSYLTEPIWPSWPECNRLTMLTPGEPGWPWLTPTYLADRSSPHLTRADPSWPRLTPN